MGDLWKNLKKQKKHTNVNQNIRIKNGIWNNLFNNWIFVYCKARIYLTLDAVKNDRTYQ